MFFTATALHNNFSLAMQGAGGLRGPGRNFGNSLIGGLPNMPGAGNGGRITQALTGNFASGNASGGMPGFGNKPGDLRPVGVFENKGTTTSPSQGRYLVTAKNARIKANNFYSGSGPDLQFCSMSPA